MIMCNKEGKEIKNYKITKKVGCNNVSRKVYKRKH